MEWQCAKIFHTLQKNNSVIIIIQVQSCSKSTDIKKKFGPIHFNISIKGGFLQAASLQLLWSYVIISWQKFNDSLYYYEFKQWTVFISTKVVSRKANPYVDRYCRQPFSLDKLEHCTVLPHLLVRAMQQFPPLFSNILNW